MIGEKKLDLYVNRFSPHSSCWLKALTGTVHMGMKQKTQTKLLTAPPDLISWSDVMGFILHSFLDVLQTDTQVSLLFYFWQSTVAA